MSPYRRNCYLFAAGMFSYGCLVTFGGGLFAGWIILKSVGWLCFRYWWIPLGISIEGDQKTSPRDKFRGRLILGLFFGVLVTVLFLTIFNPALMDKIAHDDWLGHYLSPFVEAWMLWLFGMTVIFLSWWRESKKNKEAPGGSLQQA